jgi:hypothetical protein
MKEERTMTKRFCFLLFLTAALSVNVVSAGWAPVMWDTTGINIRQGYHTEWFRSGAADPVTGSQVYTFSDCRVGDRDVYAQKFDVNGNMLWDEGGKLICRNVGRQEDSDVIYSGNGNWIFVWVDYRRTPGAPVAGDLWAQKVNSDGNPLWDPIGMPVCVASGVQINLRLVDDGNGGVMVVWEDNRYDGNDLYAQHLTATGQPAPGWPAQGIPVISYDGIQDQLTVDTDGQGGAIVAWKDERFSGNKDIYAQRIRPSGSLVWDADGLPICTAPFDQTDPKLCPDGNGGAYIVWLDRRIDNNFGDLYMQRVDSSGHTLYPDTGIVVCNAANEQTECRIMTADDNGAILVWVDYRYDPMNILGDIYAQKVNPAGTILWGDNGMIVCNAAQQQMGARFTSDGSNGAIIAWEDVRNGNGVDDADLYAQRISAAGTPMWTVNGILISNDPDAQNSALLKSDLNHGAFIVWSKQSSAALKTVQSLYIQHVNATGQIQMQANGVEFQGGINGNVENPRFVETVPGRDLLFWKDFRFGGHACIYVQLVDAQGNTYLEQNGESLCEGNISGNMEWPQYASDMMHGALVVWQDSRSSNVFRQIYAQRVDQNGMQLWTPGGVHVYDPSPDPQKEQANPFIAPDGMGGAFVIWSLTVGDTARDSINVFAQRLDADGMQVWSEPVRVSADTIEDLCYGAVPDGDGGVITTWVGGPWPNYKVYVQKLDADGHPQWLPASGLQVCPAYDFQEMSSLISDGQGGAFIAWRDKRYFIDYNVVAQHVDRSGNLMWSDSGLVICDAAADQDGISMALDGEGNVYFLWQDFRSGLALHVYMQKVTPEGEILCEPNGFPICVGDHDRSHPAMVSDTGDGVYVAWEVYQGGEQAISDIFGTHMNGDCEIASGWTANGDTVNNELYWQERPGIGPDGTGGAIVAWEDARSSGKERTYNLFMQRVNDLSPVAELPKPVPLTFSLEQNYPNPFNPATRIRYNLQNTGRVKLVIYDILGRQVRVLQNQVMTAGSHEVIWNGKTASGIEASSGIYFYKLQVDSESRVRKMVLLK